MNKEKQEKLNQKKSDEKFNSITQKAKPENQNQTHNVRSEAVEPKPDETRFASFAGYRSSR
ncbi:MAG: hypothetical protein Q4D94_05000 [Bacillota bacterium]|nr:hypothetical protein [Bacillota bacterium]